VAAEDAEAPPVVRFLAQCLQEAVDEQRAEAEREFIDHDKRGPRCQCSRDRDHLLLTAGEQPALAVHEWLKLGEQLSGRNRRFSDEPQCLAHGQAREQGPVVRYEAEPAAGEVLGPDLRRAFPAESDGAFDGGKEAGQG
jgi:hypothetical protein